MTEKNGFSNTSILKECIDPKKDILHLPCGWMTPDKRCNFKGTLMCKPIRIDWFVERNIDNLEKLEL